MAEIWVITRETADFEDQKEVVGVCSSQENARRVLTKICQKAYDDGYYSVESFALDSLPMAPQELYRYCVTMACGLGILACDKYSEGEADPGRWQTWTEGNIDHFTGWVVADSEANAIIAARRLWDQVREQRK